MLFLVVGFLLNFVESLSIKRFLKFELFSSKVVSEEFFLRSYCKLQFGGLS